MDQAEMQELRQRAIIDLQALADLRAPLSPGFWRQIGNEFEAMAREALLVRSENQGVGRSASRRRRRVEANVWKIDCIVDEKTENRVKLFKVRWDHAEYHPSWEAWRTDGSAVGTPIETWETEKDLRQTEALQLWREGTADA